MGESRAYYLQQELISLWRLRDSYEQGSPQWIDTEESCWRKRTELEEAFHAEGSGSSCTDEYFDSVYKYQV